MKKIALFLLLCIVTLATGCPKLSSKSTPKQPIPFKKFNGSQNEILVKFDNELAKYDCLMSGRNWLETSTSLGKQQIQELTQLRDRERQILQKLDTLRIDANARQQTYQNQEEQFFIDQDKFERDIFAAQQQQETARQLQIHRQNKLIFDLQLEKTPPNRIQRRNELLLQINRLQQIIAELESQIPPNQPSVEVLELELRQRQNRQSRIRKLYDDQQIQRETERTRLNADLKQNQQDQQNLVVSFKQQQQQQQQLSPTPSPKPNTKEVYGDCSDGESGQPTDQQKLLARTVRDNITHQLIRFTDYQYFQFENDLYVKRASGSFLADVLDLGGNLAATITNGERAKTIINASLIAFRGGRKSASIHYFQEQTADVLISSMQTSRNRVLAEMIFQLREKTVDQYPLDAALGDIIKYFYAGTLPRALQELKQNAAQSAKEAKDNVLDQKGISLSPATAKQRVGSVDAFTTLNNLAKVFADKTASDSAKTEALSRLQKIVEVIKNDKKVTDELSKDPDLKKVLDALDPASKDGLKLVNDLNILRSDAVGIVSDDVSDKIDQIISDNGTEPKGEK